MIISLESGTGLGSWVGDAETTLETSMEHVVLLSTEVSAVMASLLEVATVDVFVIGAGAVGDDVDETGTADTRYFWRGSMPPSLRIGVA